MSVEITPRGTRGGTMPRVPSRLMQLANDTIFRIFRNRRFMGHPLLSLTTLGARSGRARRSTVMYFPGDERNTWLIVASAGGTATHPAWFFNLARHPDQVWVQMGQRRVKVRPATLQGDARARAWQQITRAAPSFAGYESKTDREIPVIRLTADEVPPR